MAEIHRFGSGGTRRQTQGGHRDVVLLHGKCTTVPTIAPAVVERESVGALVGRSTDGGVEVNGGGSRRAVHAAVSRHIHRVGGAGGQTGQVVAVRGAGSRGAGTDCEAGLAVLDGEAVCIAAPSHCSGGHVDVGNRQALRSGTSHQGGEMNRQGSILFRIGRGAVGHHIHVVSGLGIEVGQCRGRAACHHGGPNAVGGGLVIDCPGVVVGIVVGEGDGGVVTIDIGGRHAGLHGRRTVGSQFHGEVIQVPGEAGVAGELDGHSGRGGRHAIEVERAHVVTVTGAGTAARSGNTCRS